LAPAVADSPPEAERTTAGTPATESVPRAAEPIPARKKTAPQTTGKRQTASPKPATSKSKKRRLCWQDGKLEVCGK
jgi:hypothetical protein